MGTGTTTPREANFPIVCVGGSAGGLDAYPRLLRHLPPDTGVAIVIVAMASGYVDTVLSPEEIAREIVTIGADQAADGLHRARLGAPRLTR
jgi:chemotaxis response regulator CheB